MLHYNSTNLYDFYFNGYLVYGDRLNLSLSIGFSDFISSPQYCILKYYFVIASHFRDLHSKGNSLFPFKRELVCIKKSKYYLITYGVTTRSVRSYFRIFNLIPKSCSHIFPIVFICRVYESQSDRLQEIYK